MSEVLGAMGFTTQSSSFSSVKLCWLFHIQHCHVLFHPNSIRFPLLPRVLLKLIWVVASQALRMSHCSAFPTYFTPLSVKFKIAWVVIKEDWVVVEADHHRPMWATTLPPPPQSKNHDSIIWGTASNIIIFSPKGSLSDWNSQQFQEADACLQSKWLTGQWHGGWLHDGHPGKHVDGSTLLTHAAGWGRGWPHRHPGFFCAGLFGEWMGHYCTGTNSNYTYMYLCVHARVL